MLKLTATASYLLISIFVYAALSQYDAGGLSVLNVLIVAVLTFVAVSVHELGHAAAVLAMRGQIRVIVAIPVGYDAHKRRLFVTGPPSESEVGGYVSYRLNRSSGRWAHILIAAAGPIASLVLALLAGLAAIYLARDPSATLDAVRVVEGMSPRLADLPSDEAVARELAPYVSPNIRLFRQSVAMALAILSGGAGLVNLIPFEGSDGEAIWQQFFGRGDDR